MATKREYLVSLGLAKSRGRFSQAAKDAANAAINKGIKFDVPVVVEKTVTVKTKDENGRTVVRTRRVDTVVQAADPRPDRPNGIYVFRSKDGHKIDRSHATACFRCSYSLQWCYCAEGPQVLHSPGGRAELYALHRKPKAVITTTEVPEKQPTRGTGGTTRRGSTRGTRRRR